MDREKTSRAEIDKDKEQKGKKRVKRMSWERGREIRQVNEESGKMKATVRKRAVYIEKRQGSRERKDNVR